MKKSDKYLSKERKATITLPLVFVLGICKIMGWLDITWTWVFAPIWIPITIVFVCLCVIFVLYFMAITMVMFFDYAQLNPKPIIFLKKVRRYFKRE